jgi:thiamine pyrophosphate-dependent acetolactate synthase large subunit-like protein
MNDKFPTDGSTGAGPEPNETKIKSRRQFLGAAAGGTIAAATLTQSVIAASSPPEQTDTRLPSDGTAKAFQDSLNAPVTRAEFGTGKLVTGAQVFANLCKDEGMAALFLCPGNYIVSHEIAQVGIPTYGGRHEGSMAQAADGFSRVTGEVVGCSGTEGPGFTNMIGAIAAANICNTPLLVLASNRQLNAEDSFKSFQFLYQQPLTQGIRKYGKRITAPERIYEYGCYAFRNLKSGVPGVVHLDFPTEIAAATFSDKAELTNFFNRDTYRTESRAAPNSADMRKVVEMIGKAERPVLVAGYGVHIRKAYEALRRVAERNEIGVVDSGPVRGAFADDHRLSMSRSNDAMMSADLLIIVGQYLMPSVGEWTFGPGVTTIRVHPVAEDIGRNWPVDLGVVSDEGLFLEALADALPRRTRASWVSEITAARNGFEAQNLEYYRQSLAASTSTNTLHPGVISQELHDFLYKGKIDPKQTVAGYGGLMMSRYTPRWLRANRAAQVVHTGYQYGAMGPELAMMIGASAAVQLGVGPQAAYKGAPVFVVCGDGGITYSINELETAAKYKIPVVAIVYNNNCWGTWTLARTTPRATQVHLFQEELRYDRVAEAYGARGEYVNTPEAFRAALQRAYDAAARDRTSTLINCQGHRMFSVGRAYPPGGVGDPEPGVAGHHH